MLTREPRNSTAVSGWTPVVVLALAMFAAGLAAWLGGWHLGADAEVYRAGARTLLRGEPLYSAEALTTLPSWVLLPFTYPPAAALLFLPLAAVPEGLAWGLFGALSVLALAVVVRVSLKAAEGGLQCVGRTEGSLRDAQRSKGGLQPRALTGRAALVGFTVLGLAMEPVWKSLFLGQINLLLMALIVVDVLVLCRRDSRWGGVLVGVAAAVKLTPLIFVPHLLFTGRWKDAARAVGTFVLLQGAMFVFAPSDAVKYWTEAATDPKRVGAVHWIFDQSLNGTMSRFAELASWAWPVAIGIAALVAVPAIWLMLRLHRRGDQLGALLVTAFYGMLLSPVSWTHHWVWAVPLVVLLAVRGKTIAAGLVALLFGSCVIMLVPNGGREEFEWGPVEAVLGNAYVLFALLGILGLAARELRRRYRPETRDLISR